MCHRHSFIVTRAGKVHDGFGLTDSHTNIRAMAGLGTEDSATYAFEWQPPTGWPDANFNDGLTQDTAPLPHWELKAKHLSAIEQHLRLRYPDMAAWEGPDVICIPENLTVFCGDLVVPAGATLTLPALTEVSGYVRADQGATLTLPALTEVSGYVRAYQGATLTLPALTKAGDVLADQGATLTLPALTEVAGYVLAYQGATLTLPASFRKK
jgi:hypothetical protein